MSTKQKTIEAWQHQPHTCQVMYSGLIVFFGNSIIDKKDREKLKSQLMKMLSFLFFHKSRSMNPYPSMAIS